jgi:hypothetical protein
MNTKNITRRRWLLGLACLWLACGWAAGEDQRSGVDEYDVKAAFIYNFTQFTEWPSAALPADNAPMVIGIIGEDPFGKTLEDVVSVASVRGRKLVVKHLRPTDDLKNCQILFFGRSEKDRVPMWLKQVKGSHALTVSDISGFAQQGGMVNLLLVNKSVKMEINQEAAEAAGLQISAKLLKLARLVKS